MIKIANFPFKDLLKTLSDGSRAVKVQQSGSIVSPNINILSLNDLSAGNSETIILQPSSGLFKKILNFYVEYSWSGASSGDLQVLFYQSDTQSTDNLFCVLSSDYTNDELRINPYKFISGKIIYPDFASGTSLTTDFYNFINKQLIYDNNQPLSVRIINNLDVQATFTGAKIFEEVRG